MMILVMSEIFSNV